MVVLKYAVLAAIARGLMIFTEGTELFIIPVVLAISVAALLAYRDIRNWKHLRENNGNSIGTDS